MQPGRSGYGFFEDCALPAVGHAALVAVASGGVAIQVFFGKQVLCLCLYLPVAIHLIADVHPPGWRPDLAVIDAGRSPDGARVAGTATDA